MVKGPRTRTPAGGLVATRIDGAVGYPHREGHKQATRSRSDTLIGSYRCIRDTLEGSQLILAGTLWYQLQVFHVFQRHFDTESLAKALAPCHFYILSRRPATRIEPSSVKQKRKSIQLTILVRDTTKASWRKLTFKLEFDAKHGPIKFRTHHDGSYFSMESSRGVFHGDAWSLATVLSRAAPTIASQEVLYVGQAFGKQGELNAGDRTRHHQKLQRIYEDHTGGSWDIFVAPLIFDEFGYTNDDHIEDKENGPDLDLAMDNFSEIQKPSIDLVEHSLIAYFVPPYNELLAEWRPENPTAAMRKMRAVGFRLLVVHLDGWMGLARFYSAEVPKPTRSHFIAHDIPPPPRRPVLRGISTEKLSEWRLEAEMIRDWPDMLAATAEQYGVAMKIFGDQAPEVRRPPEVRV